MSRLEALNARIDRFAYKSPYHFWAVMFLMTMPGFVIGLALSLFIKWA
jgi:hypothetical protein